MLEFARLHRFLDASPFHRDRAEALASYFAARAVARPAEAAWAAFLLLGGQLPAVLSASRLESWLQEEARIPSWLLKRCQEQVGSRPETLALLSELLQDDAPARRLAAAPEDGDASLCAWIERRLLPLRELSPAAQKEAVLEWWRTLSSPESLLLHHLLIGRFQPPVPRNTVEEALAQALGVSRERISQRLERIGLEALCTPEGFSGLSREGASPAAQAELQLGLPAADLFESSRPDDAGYRLEPLEALREDERLPGSEPVSHWSARILHGGVRARLCHLEGQLSLWVELPSPGASEAPLTQCVSTRFPELLRAGACLPSGTAIEGVLRPESAVLKRLSVRSSASPAPSRARRARPEPVRFEAADLAALALEDIRTLTGGERQARLADLIPQASELLALADPWELGSWEEAERLLPELRRRGASGLLLFHLRSPRRLLWKAPPLTVDAVLIYVESGQAGLGVCNFAVWQEDELVPLARVPAESLAPLDREELQDWARKNERERFGPVRSVVPEQVFELGFDEIELSARHRSGLMLKAPRILQWKKGAPPREASTLQSLLQGINPRSAGTDTR